MNILTYEAGLSLIMPTCRLECRPTIVIGQYVGHVLSLQLMRMHISLFSACTNFRSSSSTWNHSKMMCSGVNCSMWLLTSYPFSKLDNESHYHQGLCSGKLSGPWINLPHNNDKHGIKTNLAVSHCRFISKLTLQPSPNRWLPQMFL